MARPKVRLISLDDSEIDRHIMRVVCGMLNVECVAFSSQDEFLANFKYFDGAILDYGMPGKTGVEIAAIIKAELPCYPIVFRSNYHSDSSQYREMLEYGKVLCKDDIDSTMNFLQAFVDLIKETTCIIHSKYDRRKHNEIDKNENRREIDHANCKRQKENST